MKALSAFIVLVAVAFLTFWQQNAQRALRVENETLGIEELEAERLVIENRDLRKTRAGFAEAVDPGTATELLQLRNEVGLLRREQLEITRLRAENERIATELVSGKFTPRRLADMDGFMSRANWPSAGFATPEAAAQSVFAGITSGDFEQFIRCFDPQTEAELRQQVGDNVEGMQRELAETAHQFGKVTGLRIVGHQQEVDDQVALKLQLSADGEAITLRLRRVGNEWKASKESALEIGR
jgi:hypothetical protein